MEIKQTDNGAKGSFFIDVDGRVAAAMTYTYAGASRIIIDHTEVSEALKGQSIGKQLLMKLVDFARKNKLTVLPLCPFAKSVFEKLPAIGDVL
jgi:hypothetical protein